MDVFELREKVIQDYSDYVRSFLTIKDETIERLVDDAMDGGLLWPNPLLQLNPSFEPGESLPDLVERDVLHALCLDIFRRKNPDGSKGALFRLHTHQVEGIHAARAGESYVLTTGTGSGKSLSYIVPIVDHVLRQGSGRGIQAIVVYPMNALANSQLGELEKFLGTQNQPVSFKRYTGQDKKPERADIIAKPPDILLTNYVMLELMLTRPWERNLVDAARNLRFLVLDELHTYRGRQGADVAMLLRRLREACGVRELIHVGTSATLSSAGTWAEQQREVARVASHLFGAEVRPEHVIGETLRRTTPLHGTDDAAFVDALRARVQQSNELDAEDAGTLRNDPLASWLESTLGLRREPGSERLIRCTPRALTGDRSSDTDEGGVATELSELTSIPVEQCERALRQVLLAGYRTLDHTGRPLFAFRLHQFVSKGDAVYASPEPEERRHITLNAQRFVPESGRSRELLPLAFCRECGQEYYVVRRTNEGGTRYVLRNVSDRLDDEDDQSGYLYISAKVPWPDLEDAFLHKLPDSWLEPDGSLRRGQRKNLPKKVYINASGAVDPDGHPAWWIAAPFRFCLSCGVAYGSRQSSDFGKLATLGSEGRSTATTILTLSTIRRLRRKQSLAAAARKLLSFTDNRQDASLQAGHFNDFVEITLMRSALWRATVQAGEAGIAHDKLTLRVFEAMELPIELYANEPGVEYMAREETDRALREVLGYFLYRDLRRGWRVTSPNLEQCGLLDIGYRSLSDFCGNEEKWSNCHPALARCSPGDRENVCRVLLDFMRRELAIRVDFLDPVYQESIQQLSRQRLCEPWVFEEGDKLERSCIVFPRPRGNQRRDTPHFTFLSPRGGFGQFLRRSGTFQDLRTGLNVKDADRIIKELCKQLTIPGLLKQVVSPRKKDDVPGYQLVAGAMIWRTGSDTRRYRDPIRVPREPEEGLRANRFFSDFYRDDTSELFGAQAREHTAQVPSDVREQREEAFRAGRLPVLYCSPTMELGVDIAELNVVNMRNIPPTPANYAQRSGRAGRSGQPAFVFSYCSAGSPHDQYFFKRPARMVAGAVTTPRLDLENEDLLRAHVHAIWLRECRLDLGQSLCDVLHVSGDNKTLDFQDKVLSALADKGARERTRRAARNALGPAIGALVGPDSDADDWLDRVISHIRPSLDNACRRWRDLYRAAEEQYDRQHQIIKDPSRSPRDRKSAKNLRDEAEKQLRLLVDLSESEHSDFYSYRYFASEGFLPGYNFPRLPLSAFLPGRRRQRGMDEFLTRPRFLAISEFGPKSFIYHEGSRYVIDKVILPVDGDTPGLQRRAKRCDACGYMHPLGDEPGPDLCESCSAHLPSARENLFRMHNVSARRRDRINSDEEERFRLGYALETGIRFAQRGGTVSAQQATLVSPDGETLATLFYGHAATVYRMNLGWRRSADKTGFMLDVERGYWAREKKGKKNKKRDADELEREHLSARLSRVIPFVEDTKNCILIRPNAHLENEVMASLQAALDTAIQVQFQLEARELATEALPHLADRRQILLYESAEGGAGVLRRLVEEPQALAEVAGLALELCHFSRADGHDGWESHHRECEAACYDCLLSYFNQIDHRILDRHFLPDLLAQWHRAWVVTSSGPTPRDEHLRQLMALCQSSLERDFLALLEDFDAALPSHAQCLLSEYQVCPDFVYQDQAVAIFIDGPAHDQSAQRVKDRHQQEDLEDAGWTVLRFHHQGDWRAIIARYPRLFQT